MTSSVLTVPYTMIAIVGVGIIGIGIYLFKKNKSNNKNNK